MTRRTRPMRHARTPVSTGPSRRLTRRGITVGAVIGLTLSALPAWAYWTSSASTSASASAGLLKPPATVTATAVSAGVVNLKVTAGPATGPAADRYKVMRGTTPVCDDLALNATCSDTGAVPGSVNTYSVVSKLNNWISALGTAKSATTPALGTPVVTGLTDGTDTGKKGDSYTSNTTPSVKGTAEPGATVQLVVGSTVDTAAVVADGSGNWTLTPASTLSINTTLTIKAKATLNGVSTTTPTLSAFTLLIDTQAPTAGPATISCPAGVVNSTYCKGNVRLSFTGVGDPSVSSGLFLDYALGGGTSGTITSPGTSPSVTSIAAPDGQVSLSYRSRDVADNLSPPGTATSPFTVDNTAPLLSSIALANGGTDQKLDAGDTVTLTFSDATSGLSPKTFCSSWSDSSTTPQNIATGGVVTVTIVNNGSNDTLQVDTSTSSCGGLPAVGSVALGANYISGGDMTFNSTSSPSKLSWTSGAGNKTGTLTITLGSGTPTSRANPNVASANPVYSTDANSTDRAGNPVSAVTYTKSGRF